MKVGNLSGPILIIVGTARQLQFDDRIHAAEGRCKLFKCRAELDRRQGVQDPEQDLPSWSGGYEALKSECYCIS